MYLSRIFHSNRDEPIGRWGETGVPRELQLLGQINKLIYLGLIQIFSVCSRSINHCQSLGNHISISFQNLR